MADYALPKYDKYRIWIKEARAHGQEWERIKYAGQQTELELYHFLLMQRSLNFWDELSVEDWFELVSQQAAAEHETHLRKRIEQDAIILSDDQDNDLAIPSDAHSSWVLYKQRLLQNGFSVDTVSQIEHKTHRILKRLRLNHPVAGDAVKGLVVGNVQSGKTANMAALMAMAGDWGWNVFIILSGTIESLREQTQQRLVQDIGAYGNLTWIGLEHLSPKTHLHQRAQSLVLDSGAKQRYFTVCLKNSSRLKNLLDWLQSDPKKARQMRILVIDDEADQAGINTASISSRERNAVNRCIVNLVQGKNSKGNDGAVYLSMNYIGYTATPYANLLNESSLESLYPSNFIATLDVSKEYFGPQQIFGVEGENNTGLNIVRVIAPEQLTALKSIHEGHSHTAPTSLIEAMCWFICCAAAFRVWGIRKPVSMLIHTSQRTDHHTEVANTVHSWFTKTPREGIVAHCHEIWAAETVRFSKQHLFAQYEDYARSHSEVCDYPQFEELLPHILTLIAAIKHIALDDESEFVYHDGIHLCIDNCKYTKACDEGDHVRLAYPNADNMPALAPAFIVIGGATLSRGLTIEGLVSTYFLRSVTQADTLMQMGRWFGYRKKYELLPRIWITTKTHRQFIFLSTLDLQLRREIKDMERRNCTPREYAPRLRNTPQVSFIRITAKNRMQSAVEADFDFSGVISQTTVFDDSEEIQKRNCTLTEAFLLGLPERNRTITNPFFDAKTSAIWTGVPFATTIAPFLRAFKFQKRARAFSDMAALTVWLEAITAQGKLGPWNVKLAGLSSSQDAAFPSVSPFIGKIHRSRLSQPAIEGVINIGVLRDPKDMLSDIDTRENSELHAAIQGRNAAANIRALRAQGGMNTTPLLVIYRIAQDKAETTDYCGANENRSVLDAPHDIVGLCICIPGGKPDGTYAAKLHVRLTNELFDGNCETEEQT